MVRAKSLTVFLSLLIIASASAAYGGTAKKKSRKKLAHKTAAAKTVSSKSAAKSMASKSAVRHTAVKTPVRPLLKRTLFSSRTRKPSVAWKDAVDRASKGNSAEGDDLNGEDLTVREAALEALGPLNGSVLVADPKSGRILSVVNQRLAFSGGEQPCSTIKLPVALAALSEGLINRDTQIKLNRRFSLNLTEAIA